MKNILIVEDELNFAKFVELELRHEQYNVTAVYDGKEGLRVALEQDFDIILLDIMLPGLNGFEVCQGIRKHKSTPIIMLTARDSVMDRVSGLDQGADDYLSKPFAIEELLARIRAIHRRIEPQQEIRGIGFRDLRLDDSARTVKRGDTSIELTKREFDLVSIFMKNINRVLTRDVLLDRVWGHDTEVETNVVDVYVRYIRNKLDVPGEESYIQTLRGVGYVMR